MDQSEKTDRPPRRRWLRFAALLLLLCALLIVLLPWIVAETPLRNVLLNRALASRQMRGSIGRASLGWFAPTAIRDLQLARLDEQLRADVQEISLGQSWWRAWMGLPDLGHVLIERPRLSVIAATAALPERPATRAAPGRPRPAITMSATVNNAALQVFTPRAEEPAISLENLNLAVRIARQDDGRLLTLEPLVVFDQHALSPQVCEQGLQLVAPILAHAVQTEGRVSLELTEFQLPLDGDQPQLSDQRTRIRGVLQLHQVTTGLRNPLLRRLTSLISGLLRVDLPTTLRVADNTQVDFHLRDGRLFHDGLTFLLPEISDEMVWRSSGSVGLDETLDLTIQARLPLTLVHDGPLTRRLSQTPLEILVTGTLDEPRLELPPDRSWLKEAADLVLSDTSDGEDRPLAMGILDMVGQLLREEDEQLDGEGETAGEEESSVVDLMRARIQARRKAREARESEEDQPQRGPLRRLFGRGAGSDR